MRAVAALIRREWRLGVAQGGGTGLAVGFFAIVITLFAFGIGPDLPLLAKIGPGLLWVAALLSALLTLDRMFQADFDDGALEHLRLSVLPLEVIVLVKALMHWLLTAVPLVLAAPVLAVELNLDGPRTLDVVLSLLAGTPALSLIGAAGAALTCSLRKGSLLLPFLILPLAVPVLIFGASAANGSASALALTGAISLVALAIGPIAGAAALRALLD